MNSNATTRKSSVIPASAGSFVVLFFIGCNDVETLETVNSLRQPSAVTKPTNQVVVAANETSTVSVTSSKSETFKAVAEAEIHRPTKLPDRIVLTWSGDPSKSQSVTWRTDTTVEQGLAEIAVADDNASFAKRARQIKAKQQTLKTGLSTARYHSVEFAALTPATKYAYRVGDGANWSEWFHFQTASDREEPFSFIYFGDAQNDLKSMWSRVIRQAFVDAPNARFLIHAGDLINVANNDAHWGEWFQAGGWLNGMIPSIPAPGNHEYMRIAVETDPSDATLPYNVKLTPMVTEHWRPQFTLPENGPAGLEETAYFVDFQGVRIVTLNSNEKHSEQAIWLDKVLSSNPGRWTVLTFHHPIYSSAGSRDNIALRKAWQPVIDKHRVDIVLQGHDHTYARSGLASLPSIQATASNENAGKASTTESSAPRNEGNLTRGTTTHSTEGTVYVVSVSGPKMYDLGKPLRTEFRRVAEDTQLYQVITIDGDELRYTAKTATGVLYDGFTLKKREGKSNQLIEQVPATPQRLRTPKPAITIPSK